MLCPGPPKKQAASKGSRTGANQTLNSITATLQNNWNGVISRVELREDGSNKKPYVDSDGKATDSQTTLGLQIIYPF